MIDLSKYTEIKTIPAGLGVSDNRFEAENSIRNSVEVGWELVTIITETELASRGSTVTITHSHYLLGKPKPVSVQS